MRAFSQEKRLMLNLEFLRQHPAVVRESLGRRGVSVPLAEIVKLAEQRRGLITRCEALRVTARRVEEAQQASMRAVPPEARAALAAPLLAARREIRDLE